MTERANGLYARCHDGWKYVVVLEVSPSPAVVVGVRDSRELAAIGSEWAKARTQDTVLEFWGAAERAGDAPEGAAIFRAKNVVMVRYVPSPSAMDLVGPSFEEDPEDAETEATEPKFRIP